ncbi:MAG: Amuc_1100 family pilus-like protein [Luteolibacter sp.]
MNWIKSNPFVAGLAGVTLVLCAALYLLASSGASRYEAAETEFKEAAQAVAKAEGVKPYPTPENRDGKRKALTEYAAEIGELRSQFDAYRPGELKNVSVQAFTNQLKSAAKETGDALKSAGCELPDGYFLGFEQYRGQLANSNSTGVLLYQVEAMKQAMQELAAARPSQLIRIYREPVPEENEGQLPPETDQVAREFGFEVTFKGSETSVRKFLSSLGKTGDSYFIVRCVEVQNERDTPPRTSDARFESAVDADAVNPADDNPFSSPFVLPGDAFVEEGAAEPAADEPAAEEPAEPEAPAAPEADSSRILAQVLGNEELIVMVRFDVAMFLPSSELPKP